MYDNCFNDRLFNIINLYIYTYMNRSLKPASLIKRKPQSIQLSPTVFKCYDFLSAVSLKNNKFQPQLAQIVQVPQSIENSTKQQEMNENQTNQNIQVKQQTCEVSSAPQKKNIYRSRKKDKSSSLSRQKITMKIKLTENNRLLMFFRNQIMTLISILGKRQQYINSLRGNKVSIVIPPLKSSQIEDRLISQLNGKGKDKTRKNFNHLTNQQLRCLKYKPRPVPLVKKQSKNKQQNEQQNEDEKGQGQQQQQEDSYPDMATWKRKNGVGINQKVFIVKGGYSELRKTLLAKGWAQNQQVRSKFFDLKWTTKICDINYSQLKNGQFVNHFNNNHHLTSKYGITRRLRTLPISHNIDIDRFYPRCFDLGDQAQFENFIENFKFCFAESVAKRFLFDKQRYKNLQLKIRVILKILKKYTLSLGQKITRINNGQFPLIDSQQWQIITETDSFPEQMKAQKLKELRQLDPLSSLQLTEQEYFGYLHQAIEKQLDKLKAVDPQFCLNGHRNVWIAKPNFLSRGRGIRCFNNLFDIADYCLGRDVQFVIQKYIQKPLLIQGRKFDIRQWVVIQDYCPPKIYFYEQCYLRFSMDDYSLDNIHNRFIHLTNNSIQKHNKKCNIDESMWEMAQFAKHIGQQNWQKIKQKIKNIVVWSIKSCQNHVTAKKGSFQFVGFDFMIDQNLNPWLIQINMSPSMDSSTPVTKKLVKMVLHDTALLISSTKNKKSFGNFTCIHENETDLANFKQYVSKQ